MAGAMKRYGDIQNSMMKARSWLGARRVGMEAPHITYLPDGKYR